LIQKQLFESYLIVLYTLPKNDDDVSMPEENQQSGGPKATGRRRRRKKKKSKKWWRLKQVFAQGIETSTWLVAWQSP